MTDAATLSTPAHLAENDHTSPPPEQGLGEAGQNVQSTLREQPVGSVPVCTLCLDANGRQATRCVIRREDYRSAVRCSIADSNAQVNEPLNGPHATATPPKTDESTPQQGYRISLGPINIEVLDPQQFTFHQGPQGPPEPTPDADQQERHSLVADLSIAKDQARQRARKLLRGLRTTKEEVQSLRQALSEALTPATQEGDDSCQDHAAEQLELRYEQQRQHEQQQQWEQQRANAETELAEIAADLDKQRSVLHEERGNWEQVRTETEIRATRSADLIDQQLAEAETKRTDFQRQCDQWEAVQAEAQSQLDARAQQIDAREAELDRRPVPADPPAVDPCIANERRASNGSPDFQVAGLERLTIGNATINKPDNDDSALDAESNVLDNATVTVESAPLQQQPMAEEVAEEDDEESVDKYMAKLLGRVHDGGDQPDPPAPSSVTLDKPPAPQAPHDDSAPEQLPAESAESARDDAFATPRPRPNDHFADDPIAMTPRAVAPEKGLPLLAMRELAQFSAQSAIEDHARNRLHGEIKARQWMALAALVGAGAGFWFWTNNPADLLAQGTMLCCGVVGLTWTVQCMVMSKRLLARDHPHLPEDQPPTEP